jgi:uncharacterized membrane protein
MDRGVEFMLLFLSIIIAIIPVAMATGLITSFLINDERNEEVYFFLREHRLFGWLVFLLISIVITTLFRYYKKIVKDKEVWWTILLNNLVFLIYTTLIVYF